MSQMEREIKTRAISNWLANVVNVLTEQYRRPNYVELMQKIDAIDKQLPELKRMLIYLNNTSSGDK